MQVALRASDSSIAMSASACSQVTLGRLYTHGRWVVKEGQQDRFQAAWKDLAEWTNAEISGAVAGEARLLQDLDDPTLFYHSSPTPSARLSSAKEKA
jgi:hypothetical protein